MASIPSDLVKKIPSLVLVITGIALLFYSFTLPLASMDGSITVLGRTADLSIQFYEAKADYNASAEQMGIAQSGVLVYTEGMSGGQFGDAMGLLKGSNKKFSYSIEPYNHNATALVLVNTSVDMIPFWPAIVKQNVVINVTLISARNISEIHIDKVYIRVWGEFNEGTRKYGAHIQVWEIDVNDMLTEVGQQKTYECKIKVDTEMGERLGIIGMADIRMIDENGNPDLIQPKDIPEETAPELSINIQPLTTGQTISVLMAVLAYPLSIMAAVLSVIGIVLLFAAQFIKKSLKKYILGTLTAGGVVGLIGVLSFYSGINTLVELIGFERFLSWSNNIAYPAAGSVLLLAAAILAWLFMRPGKDVVEFKAVGHADPKTDGTDETDEGREDMETPDEGKEEGSENRESDEESNEKSDEKSGKQKEEEENMGESTFVSSSAPGNDESQT